MRLGESVSYRSAGTVEFVYDTDRGEFFFLEVNTRLQVEHGVTEAVTGIDLVEWMLRVAAGDRFELTTPPISGSSIEVRVYAEDPTHGFRPSTGLLTHASFPSDIRIDSWIENGTVVTPYYDPLLAKMIVRGADRNAAVTALRRSLDASEVAGIETNLDYLRQFVATPSFSTGGMTTRALDGFAFASRSIEVVAPGTQTTVQDYPGRLGYWDVGVPPSGPMDSLSFRLANRAVGNPSQAAALEITISGPTLRFNTATVICLAGAAMSATLDGRAVDYWKPVDVAAGSTLAMGPQTARDAEPTSPSVAASMFRATWEAGRRSPLESSAGTGEGLSCRATCCTCAVAMLSLGEPTAIPLRSFRGSGATGSWACSMDPTGRPTFSLRRISGSSLLELDGALQLEPHRRAPSRAKAQVGAYRRRRSRPASVQHPRQRLRDRRHGFHRRHAGHPRPRRPVPRRIRVSRHARDAELWKLGQLRPGDRVRFKPQRAEARRWHRTRGDHGRTAATRRLPARRRYRACGTGPTPLRSDSRNPAGRGQRPRVVYRHAGDANLLIEYGEPVLDLELRLRVHALMQWLGERRLDGVIDLTPGIRSLQVHYDAAVAVDRIGCCDLLVGGGALARRQSTISEIPTRIVHLPLSWDDPATRLAIDKYMQSVRAGCALVPEQHRIHPPDQWPRSIEQVKDIVFEASYLVLGLGDVYLGRAGRDALRSAPSAGHDEIQSRPNLDPGECRGYRRGVPVRLRHGRSRRLSIRGPHLPDVEHYKATPEFASDRPWLLRFFDQIRFFPVTAEQLLEFRADFAQGCAHSTRKKSVQPRAIPPVPLRQRSGHRAAQAAPTGRVRVRKTPVGSRPRRGGPRRKRSRSAR